MDLLSAASSDSRILTARHISADTSTSEPNNDINTTLLCHSYSLQPDFISYSAALQSYSWVLWSCGSSVLLLTVVLFVLTLWSVRKHWRDSITNVTAVLAVYPIVSAAGFLAIVLPRARLLSEATAQQAVMVALYHLFCIIIAECGGPEKLVRCAAGARLETRVPPCCCWPCCVLPRPKLQQRYLTRLRYVVLQVPIIQAILYFTLMALSSEDMMLYHRNFVYVQPFIAASILSGVWAIAVCVRVAEGVGRRPRPRFLVLQMVLIIVKLQCGLAKALPDLTRMPCVLALNPSVYANLIHNSVMMLEMLVLSVMAWRLYSAPPGEVTDKVRHVIVAVLEDSRSIDATSTGVVENKSCA